MSKPIPEGFTSVTPVFTFKDCRKAIEFYKQAFGAQEIFVMPGPGGEGVMHAELKIGNSIIMMGEEHPQMSCKSAESLGGSPINFYVYVENVDQSFRRALEAGAKSFMGGVEDMFWGDRTGTVEDLFGYRWAMRCATRDASDTVLGAGWASNGYSAADIDPGTRGVGLLLHEGGLPVRLRSYWLDDDTMHAIAARAEALRRGEAPDTLGMAS